MTIWGRYLRIVASAGHSQGGNFLIKVYALPFPDTRYPQMTVPDVHEMRHIALYLLPVTMTLDILTHWGAI